MKNILNHVYNSYLNFRFIVWFVFIHEFIFDFYQLEGESMIPTFNAFGDIVIVEKISKSLGFFKPIKGEIICLTNPVNENMSLCKRIIYLEGEFVKLSNGNEYIVPKNHIWVEGDNKDNSLDSRKFGAIPLQLIQGRIYYQIWPKLLKLKH
jgi:inner membrane protease subunit 1